MPILFSKRFQPKWSATLLTLFIVALFVQLSIWQWHRYQFKKNLQTTYAAQLQAPPRLVTALLDSANPMPSVVGYVKVIAEGYYDNHQFLLDNRIKNNQIGFDVITPLKLTTGQVILVDRGFVAANIHRKINQIITPPHHKITITGLLTLPSKSFVLGDVIEPQQQLRWPLMIMRLDPIKLSSALGYPLAPYVILLDPTQPAGFLRQWTPKVLSAAQSLGYCFQWLAMALTVVIIYIVMNLKPRETLGKKKEIP